MLLLLSLGFLGYRAYYSAGEKEATAFVLAPSYWHLHLCNQPYRATLAF